MPAHNGLGGSRQDGGGSSGGARRQSRENPFTLKRSEGTLGKGSTALGGGKGGAKAKHKKTHRGPMKRGRNRRVGEVKKPAPSAGLGTCLRVMRIRKEGETLSAG